MKNKSNFGLLLVRLAIGVPMLLYGINKVFNGVEFIKGLLTNVGLPEFISYGVYVGEIVAPILLIIGFRSRMAGILFFLNCLTIILLSQTANVFSLNANGGWALELLGMYAFIALSLVFTGGGKWAVSSDHSWD